MNVFPRLTRVAAFTMIAAAIALSGCDKDARPHEAKEGARVFLDGLFYQVQLSRALNPRDVEDSFYLEGQPEPKPGESYFGVFMRVDNEDSKKGHRRMPLPIENMKIVDANGDEYEPIEVKSHGWGYEPEPIGEGARIPIPDTPADIGPIRGSLILFRIPETGLDSRPLELEIEGREQDHHAEITLDV